MAKRAHPHLVTITTRVPKIDVEQFKARAKSKGLSMSRLICLAMQRELSGENRNYELRILRCLNRKGYHETGDC